MKKKPRYGGSYYYIEDNMILNKMYVATDQDLQRMMMGNCYFTIEEARLALSLKRLSRRKK